MHQGSNLPFDWNCGFEIVHASFVVSARLSLDAAASAVVIAFNVDVDVFALARTFG